MAETADKIEHGGVKAATVPPVATPRRMVELDLLRGVALFVMVFGHNLRVGYSGDSSAQIAVMGIAELFSSLFMIVSGVNVLNFHNKYGHLENFNAARFYVKSSLFMLVFGYTYNLLVHSTRSMDIIQVIALGMLITYLLLYARTPNWLVGLITVLFFVTGILAFGNGLELAENVNRHFLLNYLIGNGQVNPTSIDGLIPARYLFYLFGPIPWIGYFTYGLFLTRLSPVGKKIMMALCVGMVVAATYLPYVSGAEQTVVAFKTNLRYILQTLGLFGFWLPAFEMVYRGRTKIGQFLERWGVQSLIILMFHWMYIFLFSFLAARLAGGSNIELFRWIRLVLVLSALFLTVQPLANLQNRLIRSPSFAWKGKVMLYGGLAVSLFGMFAASKGAVAFGVLLAFFGKFPAAIAFTFLYPALRGKWRKQCTRS